MGSGKYQLDQHSHHRPRLIQNRFRCCYDWDHYFHHRKMVMVIMMVMINRDMMVVVMHFVKLFLRRKLVCQGETSPWHVPLMLCYIATRELSRIVQIEGFLREGHCQKLHQLVSLIRFVGVILEARNPMIQSRMRVRRLLRLLWLLWLLRWY